SGNHRAQGLTAFRRRLAGGLRGWRKIALSRQSLHELPIEERVRVCPERIRPGASQAPEEETMSAQAPTLPLPAPSPPPDDDRPPTVEVAAMFEDALVEVHHLEGAPPARRAVHALLGGALSLATAFASFVVVYLQVAEWKKAWESSAGAHHAWTASGVG